MDASRKLAGSEWEIMEGVWQCEAASPPYGVTVRDVHGHLYPKGEKAYTTVQTVMNILVDKGFLTREKIGMVGFYRAVTSREEMARQETRTLVSRAFGGSFLALANHLVDSEALSARELETLKHMIDVRERKKKQS